MNDIVNLRQALIDHKSTQMDALDVPRQILHVWNAAVRLGQRMQHHESTDNVSLQDHIIPQMRLLVVDVQRAYREPSKDRVFYCLVHTFKAFIAAGDHETAEKLFMEADRMFHTVRDSGESSHLIVQLYTRRADQMIADGNGEMAINSLRGMVEKYRIESSCLVSFVYEKAVSLKSASWCGFALSVIGNSDVLAEEWKEQLVTLMAQLLLNDGKGKEATEYIRQLQPCLNVRYLSLKCEIISIPMDDRLKLDIFNFIQETTCDRRVLVAMCLFIADRLHETRDIAIEFITRVLTLPDLDVRLRSHVLFSAARVACEMNNSEFAQSFNSEIVEHSKSGDQVAEIASLFWNKAVDTLANGDNQQAISWMESAKNLISEDDNHTQACCSRFLCQCLCNIGEFEKSLDAAEEALQRDPQSVFSYLSKFRVLKNMERMDDATSMIVDVLRNSPFLETFDQTFFTSMSAELYEAGSWVPSMDCLVTFLDTKSMSDVLVQPSVFVSAFAILQRIDDYPTKLKYIRFLAHKWPENIRLTEPDRTAVVAVTYAAGSFYARNANWKKGAECFVSGARFAGEMVNIKGPCIFEAVDCLIENNRADEGRRLMDELSPLLDGASQKIRDGFVIAQIKVELATTPGSSSILAMIDEISSPDALAEICDFVNRRDTNYSIVAAVLSRANDMDQGDHEITASLLHQLVVSIKTKDQLRECYEMIFNEANIPHVSPDQLQFFMAKAWNTGVQLAKSRRPKESEWWFAKALKLMKTNSDLCDLYQVDLEDKYTKFLEHEYTRSCFQF